MSDSKISETKMVEYPEIYIRKSDLDDVEPINAFIDEEISDNLNLLYDYPNIVTLFERYLFPKLDHIFPLRSWMMNNRLLVQPVSMILPRVFVENMIIFMKTSGKNGLIRPITLKD